MEGEQYGTVSTAQSPTTRLGPSQEFYVAPVLAAAVNLNCCGSGKGPYLRIPSTVQYCTRIHTDTRVKRQLRDPVHCLIVVTWQACSLTKSILGSKSPHSRAQLGLRVPPLPPGCGCWGGGGGSIQARALQGGVGAFLVMDRTEVLVHAFRVGSCELVDLSTE